MAEQSVTLNPGESRVVSFSATPSEARTYQVLVDGLTGSFAAIAPVGLIGDLNDDGVVNVLDITLLERYIAGLSVSTPLSQEEFLRRADVNGDGVVNSLDITALETLIAGDGNGAGFYWLRPTGHVANGWNDAELAYDGWTDTRAEVVNVGTQRWSPYLEFNILPTEISAVRWWGSSPVSPSKVQVLVFYSGAWPLIYEGSAVKMWDEGLPIPGGAQVISGARIRFYNPSRSIRMKFRVNEFQFFGYAEEPPPPPTPPPTTNLRGYVTNKQPGAPIAGAIGNVYQDKGTETWPHALVTNAEGYYEIIGMIDDADQTLMAVYATGYKTYTNENVPISEGDNTLNIQMLPV